MQCPSSASSSDAFVTPPPLPACLNREGDGACPRSATSLLNHDGMYDVLFVVFEFIPSADLWGSARCVCGAFAAIASRDRLWTRRWLATITAFAAACVTGPAVSTGAEAAAALVSESRQSRGRHAESLLVAYTEHERRGTLVLPPWRLSFPPSPEKGDCAAERAVQVEQLAASLADVGGMLVAPPQLRAALIYFEDEPNACARHRRRTRFRASYFDEQGNQSCSEPLREGAKALFDAEQRQAIVACYGATQLRSYVAPPAAAPSAAAAVEAPVSASHAFGLLFPVFVDMGAENAGLFLGRVDEAAQRLSATAAEGASSGVVKTLVASSSLRQAAAEQASAIARECQHEMGGKALHPLFSLRDIVLYHYLISHSVAVDVNQHCFRESEEKFACCTRVVAPTGATVELRFFLSCLGGSFPRVYVKLIYCPSTFAEDVMPEKFEGDPGMRTDVFTGGFGRVEVDVRPSVNIGSLRDISRRLRLPVDFPMQLLWNALLCCSGGLLRTSRHTSSFLFYYRHTFAHALEEALELPARERVYPPSSPA